MLKKKVFENISVLICSSNGKRKNTPKLSKRMYPEQFLRKYLKCPVCGEAMTGAPSTSQNGNKYHYYNCSSVSSHFRCRAEDAIENFIRYVSGLKPNKAVLDLYHKILSEIKNDNNNDLKLEVKSLNIELDRIKSRLSNIEDMFVDKEIDKNSYDNMKKRYNMEIDTINGKIDIIQNPNRSKIEPKLKYSISLINNMDSYIRDGKIEVKCKLISSMFPERIVYDGKSYRTNSYNSVLDLIYKQTNTLRGDKKKIGESFSTFSDSVPGSGTDILNI